MGKIYVLTDSQGRVQPIEERCVVWDGNSKTALACYKDKDGINKQVTKLITFSCEGPNIMIQGQRYYISDTVLEVNVQL